ncbi:hypothetical protein KJ564_00310 [bacterium]|nr:hypothetical protein [bacterium]MBU1880512.1 hypothetical protein [bacterium]
MGKVFIDRREGERRIGERRDRSPEGTLLMNHILETRQERRDVGDRREQKRRDRG